MTAKRRGLLALALLALSGLAAGAPALAQEQPANPPGMELEVSIAEGPETPYEQEMLLLSIRGYYPRSIARQVLEQPDFEGFGWMQLGRDRWQDTIHEGRQVSALDRTMVLFPERSGRLEIAPFVHRVTTVTGSGSRVEKIVRSLPFVIEVLPKPEIAGGAQGQGEVGAWWLPARSISVTDVWDKPPDQLELGELATRTVTLEVEGVGPQRLPPAPEMRANGVIAFTDPEERSHELTPEGPISRVTWRWTIRPMTGTPAVLEEVRIPWFDTQAREQREILLPAQRIALAGAVEEDLGPQSLIETLAARALPIGALAGLLLGLLLLLPGLRLRSRAEVVRMLRRLLPDPQAVALRRAARAGDVAAFWRAARELLRRDRAEGGAVPLEPRLAEGLRRLDRLLFGPREEAATAATAAAPLDLRALGRGLLTHHRAALAAARKRPA